MKAILIVPGQMPEHTEINPGLSALQSAVEGYIECVSPAVEGWTAYGNEEAKLVDLAPNPVANFLMAEMAGHNVRDMLRGNVIVIGHTPEGDTASVPAGLLEKMHEVIAVAEAS